MRAPRCNRKLTSRGIFGCDSLCFCSDFSLLFQRVYVYICQALGINDILYAISLLQNACGFRLPFKWNNCNASKHLWTHKRKSDDWVKIQYITDPFSFTFFLTQAACIALTQSERGRPTTQVDRFEETSRAWKRLEEAINGWKCVDYILASKVDVSRAPVLYTITVAVKFMILLLAVVLALLLLTKTK